MQLAKENFHLILVGRNDEKLKEVALEIKDKFNDMVFTRTVCFDFVELSSKESVE